MGLWPVVKHVALSITKGFQDVWLMKLQVILIIYFHLLVLLINLFIFTSAELAPAQPPGNLFPSRDIR